MMIISKFLRRLKMRRELRRKRQLGIYDATLYLIIKEHERIKSKWKVAVFGEFTDENPWQLKIPCVYDTQFECFKVDVKI
jgi:hypothetical protein